ncbi:MAG: hypothetical protein K0U98_17035 [Deltaproteobacteria bacterium]|nr:hypothetical protein [Deltaproteobacteria bacterium]
MRSFTAALAIVFALSSQACGHTGIHSGTDHYRVGNPASETVIVNAQGGPVPFLFTDRLEEMLGLGATDLYAVNVHQAQTRAPSQFNDRPISFEEAKAFDTGSVRMLAEVVRGYKEAGKTVYVVGISFGAFVVQDLLATQGNLADGYLIVVGRLDMPQRAWHPFSEGRFAGFKDGVEIVDFASAEEAGMGGDGSEFVDGNMAKLAAGLGYKRFTDLLAEIDLSNVVYAYGRLDEQVGRLTQEEVSFLKERGATVLSGEGNHGATISEFVPVGLDLLLTGSQTENLSE